MSHLIAEEAFLWGDGQCQVQHVDSGQVKIVLRTPLLG